MNQSRPFRQVDVFTAAPYRGNPLAVVLGADGLCTEDMQRFARWTNLSETSFLLAPGAGADYRVRIFTPGGELPFAGHPTLGSCHAWLEHGGLPREAAVVVQECEVGLIRIRRDGARLSFAAPPLQRSDMDGAVTEQICAALRLAPRQVRAAKILDNGPVWFALLVDDEHAVVRLAPDHAALKQLGHKVGVAAIRPAGSGVDAALDAALLVRAFAAPAGVDEDPVTGSLNASLAQWLMDDGLMPRRYVAEQGSALGREGRVHIERDGDLQVWVGGDCATCISGTAFL